ncbi:NlpC/P60 family protein [Luteipulveratus mongoliensis]|nr:NlpC/P60 family protein [Luteipulveratus mongoliensis]
MGSANKAIYQFVRHSPPARTDVYDGTGKLVATFTDRARTVTLAGPARTFAEAGSTSATVRQSTWVRVAPRAWSAGEASASWVRPWLNAVVGSPVGDILTLAMQYVDGAPNITDADGTRYAGDAAYGPIVAGEHLEGSDIQDYLGVPWTFDDGVTRMPRTDRYGMVDCSGFVRLLLGLRFGFPLLSGYVAGPGLPRRAQDLAARGPGTMVIPDTGVRPTNLAALRPGDLLFFSTEGDGIINHVAFYLGIDSAGRRRFFSSRKTFEGPTMGDVGGVSVLDGNGYYAVGLRSARRV